ncbi:MAG: GNAT family N-acetyltransferase [Acidobacteriota bacterium]
MTAKKRAKTPFRAKDLVFRAVTSDDWSQVESLFGERGACGGCWCMHWRLPRGGKLWEEKKGEPNRRAFRKLVRDGAVQGLLAFHDGQPVGWCDVGPRSDYPRLVKARMLADHPDEGLWSLPCFFIPTAQRGRGLATRLLSAVVEHVREQGAPGLEGYPVRVKDGTVPGAFAWTGVTAMYRKAGFREVSSPEASRPIYQRRLRRSRS